MYDFEDSKQPVGWWSHLKRLTNLEILIYDILTVKRDGEVTR